MPKAFLRHRGSTLMEHAVAYLLGHAGRVLVGLSGDRLEEGRSLVGSDHVLCLPGGTTKQDTIGLLLAAADAPVVIVHDASQLDPAAGLMPRVLAGIEGADACVPVTVHPVRGSALLTGSDGWMEAVVPRERLAFSHTPQVYWRESLVAAYAQAVREDWHESGIYALIHRWGGRVRTVAGDPEHRKITWPDDLALLEQS